MSDGGPAYVAVGIATKGRPGVLLETITRMLDQSSPPDRIVVCGTEPGDVSGLCEQRRVEILFAGPGLCAQRNTILDSVLDCGFLVFVDDDFLAGRNYIEATLAAFMSDPTIMVTTGEVLADGAVGPGLSIDAGARVLERDLGKPSEAILEPAWNGYGCNMAVRLAPIAAHGLRFDERMPLYGWFEDVDFTRRLGRFGRIVKVCGARGVHLGVKVGRTSGKRLGYSQVANPVYLAAKGSYSWSRVLRDISRHLLVNAVKSLRPEPYIDRRGRIRGNGIALGDMIKGRMHPERILEL